MADLKLIEAARQLLADVTPLDFDCGTLCGHRCCVAQPTEEGVEYGVYLIPGELPLFDGSEDWLTWQFHATSDQEFAPSWEKHGQIPFMVCHSLCRREKRPFECRTYPLVPYLHEDGNIEMRFAPWAEEGGFCPLTQRYRVDELNPAFVAACREAWTLLLQDSEMLDHVQWLTAQLKDWAELPHTAPVDDE